MMEQQSDMDQTGKAAQDTAKAQPFGAGNTLREARERMGMSVEDVAGRLKFAPRQITALEEGNFGQLPEMAFVRGFLRSYAKLLQLDEAALLAALPNAPSQGGLHANKSEEESFPNIHSSMRRSNILWLAAALGVAVVIGMFALQHDDSGQVEYKNTVAATTAPPTGTVSMVAETMPAAEEKIAAAAVSAPIAGPKPHEKGYAAPKLKPEPVKAPKAELAQKNADDTSVDNEDRDTTIAEPVTTDATGNVVPATNEATESKPAEKARLHFVFDEDSWVEVKDKDGKILLSQLGLSGSEQNVYRVPPFMVVIGHASGVRLYFKNKLVDLAPHTHTDVAHLTLE